MTKFLTQCPSCQTSFKVGEEQMQAANGVVRCGVCREVFLAGQNRIILKDKPEDLSNTSTSSPEPEPLAPAFSATPEAATDSGSGHQRSNEEIITRFDNNFHDEEIDEGDSNFWSSEADFSIAEDVDDNLPSESLAEDDTDKVETVPGVSWEDLDGHSDSVVQEVQETDDPEAENDLPEPENIEVRSEEPEDISSWEDAKKKQANFDKLLNPFGYSSFNLSSDFKLPESEAEHEISAIADEDAIGESEINNDAFSATEELAPEHEELLSDDETPDDSELVSEDDEEAFEDSDFVENEEVIPVTASNNIHSIFQSTIHSTIQSTLQSSLQNTPPTLSPDLVAQENIPVLMENQSSNWFQALRHSRPQAEQVAEENRNDNANINEKAYIHSHLSTLTDEDSLAPLAPENLQAINDEPVELVQVFEPLKSLKKVGLVLLSIVLLASLGGQYLWVNLIELSQDERFDLLTRPLCNFSQCPDRTRMDLSALITEELIIRSHPDREDALQVDFIFRNDASREQRFPLVELNFTNNTGNIIANRVFTPEEYLPEEMHLFTHMPAHSSIQVNLELVDPGEESTGYSLVFRNP